MYVDLIREAWAKANDEQRQKIALTLAGMVDKLVPRPVVVLPGEKQPTPEQIQRAQAGGFPIVYLHFGKPEDGQKKGTGAVKGA
jgi:hypothetical protein